MRRIFPLAVLLVVLLIWIIRFHRQHLSGLRSSDESALNSCASCVAAGFAWQMRSCQMSIPQDKLKPEVTHSPDVYCRKMLEPAACYTTSSQCVAFEDWSAADRRCTESWSCKECLSADGSCVWLQRRQRCKSSRMPDTAMPKPGTDAAFFMNIFEEQEYGNIEETALTATSCALDRNRISLFDVAITPPSKHTRTRTAHIDTRQSKQRV